MPTTVLADNAYGSLGASLASTASSITFTSGHGARFPAITSTASRAYATILNSNNVLEEITITTHTAGVDTADVVRAVGGTTAKAWSAGDRIEMRLSKSALDDLSLNTLTLANGATITAGGLTVTAGNVVATAGNITATAGNLTFGAASAKIIPGATNFSLRNNADSADNVLISDAGLVTVRAGVVITAGGITSDGASVFNEAGADVDFRVESDGDAQMIFVDASANIALIGKTGTALGTAGIELRSPVAGGALFTLNGTVASFNRITTEGNIIELYQATTLEGAISEAGGTITYGTFLGSHWAQLSDGSKQKILRGTVMETLDYELCEWPGERNERLPKVKVSDTAGSAKVYGVFLAWDENLIESGEKDEDGKPIMVPQPTNDMYVAAVGTFLVRMQNGQSYQNGLLVESAGDGTARVQEAQVYGPNTLGKIISAVVVETYEDGSFLVPCKLDAG